MSMKFAMSLRTARGQAILDAIGPSGKINIYSGTQPVTGGSPSGTLLGTLNLSPIPGTVANEIITFNPVSDDISADADGYASWGRIFKNNGDMVIDFDCGTTSSNATMKFTNTLFATGDTISIDSFVVIEGNA